MNSPAEQLKLRHKLYLQMATVRAFETRLLELFSDGELSGTTHTYIGQEAIASGVINHLEPQDLIVSNHRCHGHYLVRYNDLTGLFAEIMGRDGVCGGRGGSQHLFRSGFMSNGVLGSTLPVATGMALAEKKLASGAIVVVFMGDGAFGEGVVYESFNMASLWNLPLLVVVENNEYAQTTPLKLNFAGSFRGRAEAFGLSFGEVASNNVEDLYACFGAIVQRVREESRPHVEVIHTYRLSAHSKGDDDRPPEEIAMWRRQDPLVMGRRAIGNEAGDELDTLASQHVAEAEAAARELAPASLVPTTGASRHGLPGISL